MYKTKCSKNTSCVRFDFFDDYQKIPNLWGGEGAFSTLILYIVLNAILKHVFLEK